MIHLKTLLFIVSIGFSIVGHAQELMAYKLDIQLNEISGLEQLNETTLVAINDSGNDAELHLIDLQGKPIKKVFVKNLACIGNWPLISATMVSKFLSSA